MRYTCMLALGLSQITGLETEVFRETKTHLPTPMPR